MRLWLLPHRRSQLSPKRGALVVRLRFEVQQLNLIHVHQRALVARLELQSPVYF